MRDACWPGTVSLLEEVSCPVCAPNAGAEPAYRLRDRTQEFVPVALHFV